MHLKVIDYKTAYIVLPKYFQTGLETSVEQTEDTVN